MHILDELNWRGLLHQTTGGDELRQHLDTGGRVAYCGFDPTKDALIYPGDRIVVDSKLF